MADIKLLDIIECLSGVYKALDMRMAVGKVSSNEWHNALLVIRFSYSEEIVENRLKEINESFPEVATNNFR